MGTHYMFHLIMPFPYYLLLAMALFRMVFV